MKRRRRLAGTAAIAGVLLVVTPVAPGPGLAATSVDVYESMGRAQAVGMTFAVTPSIFDPLLDIGLLHDDTLITSQGAGEARALAGFIFPGSLAVGGAGCAGVPGTPWVQAYTPTPDGCSQRQAGAVLPDESSSFNPTFDAIANEVLDRVTNESGSVIAETGPHHAYSLAEIENFALAAEMHGPPILRARTLRAESLGRARSDLVEHTVEIVVEDLELLDGLIRIETLTSVARTAANVTEGFADGTLTLSGVTVAAAGEEHEARITSEGVRIVDDSLSREQQLGLQEEIEDSLLAAGLIVSIGAPVEIVGENSAEASVGGLILSVRGKVPEVTVPDELADVIGPAFSAIPTRCAYDEPLNADALPLCFGAGVLPGPGTRVRSTFTFASAASSTVADAISFDFGDFPTDLPDDFDFGGPPAFDGPVGGGGVPFDPGTGQAPSPQQPGPSVLPQGPLVGLVAKLPPGALLWPGVMLLVLALALAFGPSLRDVRPR